MTIKVAIVGDYNPQFPPHAGTTAAIGHAAQSLGLSVESVWLPTDSLPENPAPQLASYAAIWIAPGSPYRSLAGALAAIRYARENDVPLLGTCGGFQHVVLEYARHVLGFQDAAHAEYDPYASTLFISQLTCSLAGKTMEVRLAAGSQAEAAYGAIAADEQYYCNFGINPDCYDTLFARHGTPQRAFPTELIVSGADQNGEPRVIELPRHKFFLATLFVPQMRSQPGQPHPLVTAWLRAVIA